MGNIELFFHIQLGECPVERRIEEVRVIAEAAGATRFIPNQPFGLPFNHCENLPLPGKGNHTSIMRCPFSGRNISQLFEQLPVIRSVVGFRPCIAGRKYAWPGSKCIYADPGVVGEDKRIRPLAVKASLLAGVCLEGVPIFNTDWQTLDAREKFNLNITTFSRLPELPEFSWVRGGEINGQIDCAGMGNCFDLVVTSLSWDLSPRVLAGNGQQPGFSTLSRCVSFEQTASRPW